MAALAEAARSLAAEYFTEMWAWGIFAATTVQAIAQRVVTDHRDTNGLPTSHPDLVALSELGSNGQNPQNARAELENRARKIHGAPSPMNFMLPMRHTKRRHGEQVV